MGRILVDTSALVLLADRGDARHDAAVKCRRTLASGRLHVTDYVLDETLTLFRMRGGSQSARALLEEVRKARAFELVFLGPELFWEAAIKYQKFADGKASFTDCTSFAVMDHLKIPTAFTFDEDFRRAGDKSVP